MLIQVALKYFTKEGAKLNIYNNMGSRVLLKKLTSDNNRVNISELPKGLYIVKVIQGETAHTEKFFKE